MSARDDRDRADLAAVGDGIRARERSHNLHALPLATDERLVRDVLRATTWCANPTCSERVSRDEPSGMCAVCAASGRVVLVPTRRAR